MRAISIIFLCTFAAAKAQVPHIIGSWKLVAEASTYPGPLPRSQVRTYIPLDDGFLLGLVVTIDADGNASFLQFAARPDGADYPEYGPSSLARLQMSGERASTTYSERNVDEYTVEWADKFDGQAYAQGTREVSRDGATLTIDFEMRNPDGQSQDYVLVYERQ